MSLEPGNTTVGIPAWLTDPDTLEIEDGDETHVLVIEKCERCDPPGWYARLGLTENVCCPAGHRQHD